MALTDNPYLPLYVRDWQTSNKLSMCTPAAHGIMINIMCVLHRENRYGRILLRQKFKQKDSSSLNFAKQLASLLPFTVEEIMPGFTELLNEQILRIDGDWLICDKMESLAILSETRAKAGKKGGEATAKKDKNFAKAKGAANTETEIKTEIVNKDIYTKEEISKFINEALKDDIWLEATQMLYRLTKNIDVMKYLLSQFAADVISKKKPKHKDADDLKGHFSEWLKYQRELINTAKQEVKNNETVRT